MDRKLIIETAAMILLLIAFPVISAGTTNHQPFVWWTGLIAFMIGGLIPVWTRFMNHANDATRDMGIEFDDRAS